MQHVDAQRQSPDEAELMSNSNWVSAAKLTTITSLQSLHYGVLLATLKLAMMQPITHPELHRVSNNSVRLHLVQFQYLQRLPGHPRQNILVWE